MKSVMQLSLGLLLVVSTIGCNSCGHRSCLHKLFNHNHCGCGCHDHCGVDVCETSGCECHEDISVRSQKSKVKHHHFPAEAAMYGYDKSVVYTGGDWQGIPMSSFGSVGGDCGCSGGMSPMMAPSCAGCSGGSAPMMSPAPGCAGCSGGSIEPQPASSGCSSCGGAATSTPLSPIPSTSGGCASCGASSGSDSFFSPHHQSPAPAPPAEAIPGQNNDSSPGDKAATQGEPIQKIHWVPRQL